jgi:DNA-binding GntR family transcriptional regulator
MAGQRASAEQGEAGSASVVVVRGWSRRRASYEAVEHIIGQIYAGELRPGDRIDVEKVATTLNISRSPVREAVLELLRDGFVDNTFHRSAFIAPFDAAVIEDSYDLYGILFARATAQAAALDRDSPVLAELGKLVQGIQGLTYPEDIHAVAYHYRRIISHNCGTQRLRALLRSFRSFVPASYRMNMPELSDSFRTGLAAEFREIARGNPEQAAEMTRKLYRDQAVLVVADLRGKGIIE